MNENDKVIRNFVYYSEDGLFQLALLNGEQQRILLQILNEQGLVDENYKLIEDMIKLLVEEVKYNLTEGCLYRHRLSKIDYKDRSEFKSDEEYEFAQRFFPLALSYVSDEYIEKIMETFDIDFDKEFTEGEEKGFDPREVWS